MLFGKPTTVLLSYNNRKDIIKLKKWNWICLLSYKCINNWLLVHFVFKNHHVKLCWMPYILVKVLENFVLVWQRKRKLPNQHWVHCNDNSFTNRWPESLHFNSRHCYVSDTTHFEFEDDLYHAGFGNVSITVHNIPDQDYTHQDNHISPTMNWLLDSKPFIVSVTINSYCKIVDYVQFP